MTRAQLRMDGAMFCDAVLCRIYTLLWLQLLSTGVRHSSCTDGHFIRSVKYLSAQ